MIVSVDTIISLLTADRAARRRISGHRMIGVTRQQRIGRAHQHHFTFHAGRRIDAMQILQRFRLRMTGRRCRMLDLLHELFLFAARMRQTYESQREPCFLADYAAPL